MDKKKNRTASVHDSVLKFAENLSDIRFQKFIRKIRNSLFPAVMAFELFLKYVEDGQTPSGKFLLEKVYQADFCVGFKRPHACQVSGSYWQKEPEVWLILENNAFCINNISLYPNYSIFKMSSTTFRKGIKS